MKTKLKSYGYFLGVAITGIAIGALLQSAKAVWTEPTVAPPNAVIGGAPVNTSANAQMKTGWFTAGALNTNNMCIGGICKTTWPTASGDNLGTHVATQDLDMNGKNIINIAGTGTKIVKIGKAAIILEDGATSTCGWGGTYQVAVEQFNRISGRAYSRIYNGVLQTRVSGYTDTTMTVPGECDSGWVNGISASCTSVENNSYTETFKAKSSVSGVVGGVNNECSGVWE